MKPENQHSRRRFLANSGSALTLALAGGPAHASRLQLLRLHPSRFIAGLVFDVAYAVFVRLAKDVVVQMVQSGSRSGLLSSASLRASVIAPVRIQPELVFDMAAYKASIVTLGIVDYEVHRRKQIKLLLREANDDQMRRFEETRLYLHRERVPLVPDGKNLSFLVERDTSFDEILSTRAVDLPESDRQRHVENLISATGVNVFQSYV